MSCSVPMVVAKQAFLAQSSSLSATAIFTPAADGDFMVVTYVELTAFSHPTGSGGVGSTVSWMDSISSNSSPGAQANSGVGSPAVGAGFQNSIRSASGNPIEVSTSFGSADPSQTYNLYVTVIQLG